jgi:dTDP-4-amino-4,6-dideoxygalactose transaminase/D-serine deaminase-like pyridoxal phosphate-dependent protein
MVALFAATPEAAPTLMVDCAEHLDLIESELGPKAAPVRVCIDLDAGWWPAGGVLRVGPKRSPLHRADEVVALAREIESRERLRLVGLMAYEGQIAGVGDRPPGRRIRGRIIHAMQGASARELRKRRAKVVEAVSQVHELEFVNAGGTGSLTGTAAEDAVTEVTAGSGFYAPALFDHYSALSLKPAAFFALPVVRKPADGVATALGGGYLASGPATSDRLPVPWLPEGLRLDGQEGAGEVQTPLLGDAAKDLRVGDNVYMRHAKAGELCERFATLHLVQGGGIVDEVPTYRGEGRTFLRPLLAFRGARGPPGPYARMAAINPHSTVASRVDSAAFAIGFDARDRARLHSLWDGVIDSARWTEGELTDRFEELWAEWNGAPAVAMSGWTGAALAALSFAGIEGEAVLCPSNTFMATAEAILHLGGRPEFVDCNREDLCMSFEDFEAKAERHKPKAAVLVHIGGHIAFDVERIAAYCRQHGIFLLEDCAHAHGAEWNEQRPGTWGDAGAYSLYATKTISTGEGGMLVSGRPEVIDFARAYRNYGKPEHRQRGLNFRMSEFAAAIGVVQIERLEEIVDWKNAVARRDLDDRYRSRLELPEDMISGLYKYIVFEPIENSTGKVYDQPCHRLLGHHVDLPNTDWVAENHWCVPLYYHGPEL